MPRKEAIATISQMRQVLAARFASHLPIEIELDTMHWAMEYLPHYMTNRPSMMHRWLSREFDRRLDRRGQKFATIGPRGSAKSTYISLITPLKRALEGKENNILLTADTASQAVENLRSFKDELEGNDKINDHYPMAAGIGPIWKNNVIQMRNGCTVRAAGTLSRIRGLKRKQFRPSLIVLDDPENDEHTSSDTMRTRTREWFQHTLLNMGNAETNFLIAGTALHRDCLLLNCLRTPGFRTYRVNGVPSAFKAIVEWPTRMDLWDQWEAIYYDVDKHDHDKRARTFYKDHREEMDLGAVMLWPDREPLYAMMKLRAELGHQAFESEKQGNPINPETCEWPEEYFVGEDLWFDNWPKVELKVIALDPSKGKNAKRGDYSSFALVGLDANGHYWCDLNMDRRSTDRIVSDGVELYRRFRPLRLGVEANSFQELLVEDLLNEATTRDIEMDMEPITNKVKKEVRIRRLSPLLAKRRMHFRRGSKGATLCMQQMKDFPNGDHDDGPDSLEMAVRMIADEISTNENYDGLGETLEVRYEG